MSKATPEQRLLELFQGLATAYGEFKPSDETKERETGKKVGGRATTKKGTITEGHWSEHLAGAVGLGVVPIQIDGSCRWGAIDVDVYNLDFDDLERRIKESVLPLTVCRTKSGGAHLYLFLDEHVPARMVRQKLGDWSVALGYPGVEVFPKQDELAGEDDVGNWLNMPYFGASTSEGTKRYAIYEGEALSLSDFLDLASARSISYATLNKVHPVGGPMADGPPCLQTMALHGVPEGGRNETLFAMGVYAKMKYGDTWEQELNNLNTSYMNPPLGFQEVGAIAKSLARKDYKYACQKQPLCRFCSKDVCRTREYGIAANAGPDDPGVMIDSLTQLDTEPPVWFATVNGVRLQLTTDDLMQQGRFAKRCIEALRFFPHTMKAQQWQQLVNNLLSNAEVVEVPQDSGTRGQFLFLLEQFCTGQQQGKSWEDLLRGMPYTEDGRTYFRSADLMRYLTHQQYRDMKPHEVWAELRRLGADHGQKNVKGKCVQHWSIPAFVEQEEEFDVPRTTEGEGEF